MPETGPVWLRVQQPRALQCDAVQSYLARGAQGHVPHTMVAHILQSKPCAARYARLVRRDCGCCRRLRGSANQQPLWTASHGLSRCHRALPPLQSSAPSVCASCRIGSLAARRVAAAHTLRCSESAASRQLSQAVDAFVWKDQHTSRRLRDVSVRALCRARELSKQLQHAYTEMSSHPCCCIRCVPATSGERQSHELNVD